MRHVIFIREQELQLVLSWRQRDDGLRLTCAKMQMIEIARNRLVERRHIRIDQHMVMSGIGIIQSRGRDTHIGHPKADGQFRRHFCAVL